ncbi:MAG: carbohydrate-binding domain-containing protein [Clostridiales bacterium]|nr:carbohydrate-binding domain-containing protein [Clostridiales bacterium]
MKKLIAIILTLIFVFVLASCGGTTSTESGSETTIETDAVKTTDRSTASEETTIETDAETTAGTVTSEETTTETEATAVTDESITAKETIGTFEISSSDGTFSTSGNVVTISSAGTYVLTGLLEGQILVDAGEDDEVVIELSGVTITCGSDSPVKIVSAGNVDISAKKGTENVINDTRSAKVKDDDTQGEGAIYATCDLKIKGTGTLVVNASYNNGIHTKDDLKIQNVSLKVTAYNNALKGNDSITFTSGTIVAISTNGDGVKTENTDVSKNGVTRGDITVAGATVTVYAAGDGFQAAHNFVMTEGEDGTLPTVTVYTGSYSGYTASSAATTSYKGVKVQNELNIEDGTITLHTYDDGLHADYGTSLDDGTKGKGTINILGGTVTMSVYAPENKTAGGRMGPGGWGGQQTVSGADGIHADNVLNISGGTINIDSAYEGLEANVINISGGKTYVAANDDGVNSCKGNSTPAVNVTGGYLDVTVSPSGDTDGIDSNGTYKQTGGVVITRGSSNQNMAAIDADSSVTISGGTLIILGYGRVSTSGSVKTYSLSLHSKGSHTVKIDGTTYTFTNAYAYGITTCYSSVSVSS